MCKDQAHLFDPLAPHFWSPGTYWTRHGVLSAGPSNGEMLSGHLVLFTSQNLRRYPANSLDIPRNSQYPKNQTSVNLISLFVDVHPPILVQTKKVSPASTSAESHHDGSWVTNVHRWKPNNPICGITQFTPFTPSVVIFKTNSNKMQVYQRHEAHRLHLCKSFLPATKGQFSTFQYLEGNTSNKNHCWDIWNVMVPWCSLFFWYLHVVSHCLVGSWHDIKRAEQETMGPWKPGSDKSWLIQTHQPSNPGCGFKMACQNSQNTASKHHSKLRGACFLILFRVFGWTLVLINGGVETAAIEHVLPCLKRHIMDRP